MLIQHMCVVFAEMLMVIIFLKESIFIYLFKRFFIQKGNNTNDFVDRKNIPVALDGDKYTQYFNWGSSWRVIDDSADSNQTL